MHIRKHNLQQREEEMKENIDDSIEGYSLFSHVRDTTLQRKNRAMAVANIIQDNLTKDGLVSQGGMYKSMKYWDALPDEEKTKVYQQVACILEDRKLLKGGEL